MLTFNQLYDIEEEKPKQDDSERDRIILYYIGLANAGMFLGK